MKAPNWANYIVHATSGVWKTGKGSHRFFKDYKKALEELKILNLHESDGNWKLKSVNNKKTMKVRVSKIKPILSKTDFLKLSPSGKKKISKLARGK